MAGLLVSVRSAEEARAAVEGGASVVDVKEPDHGPLGRASASTWRAVREAVPLTIPVSVALGELSDWSGAEGSFDGISFRKIGLADSGPNWRSRWVELRRHQAGGARWVAVAYADWRVARAPHPDEILEAALEAEDCSGVLVDTWDKSVPSPLDATPEWFAWVSLAQRSGRFVALAGGLDLNAIARLAPLRPDLFAVRGAACDRSDRLGHVRADRVAELARAVRDGVSGRGDLS
jgi:(5-formylfuran-3-yl)methyl phosphate synthase